MAMGECPNCESREYICKQIIRKCECLETFICRVCAISKIGKLKGSPSKDEQIAFLSKEIYELNNKLLYLNDLFFGYIKAMDIFKEEFYDLKAKVDVRGLK
jgi:hypothetical protein